MENRCRRTQGLKTQKEYKYGGYELQKTRRTEKETESISNISIRTVV